MSTELFDQLVFLSLSRARAFERLYKYRFRAMFSSPFGHVQHYGNERQKVIGMMCLRKDTCEHLLIKAILFFQEDKSTDYDYHSVD